MSQPAAVQTTKEDLLIAEIQSMRGQIVLIQKRTTGDDLTARLFDTALMTIDSLMEHFDERLNAEADDYNSLADRYEGFHETVRQAMGTLSLILNAPVDIDTLQQSILDLQKAHAETVEQFTLKHHQLAARCVATETEYKQYKKAHPATLHTRIDALEKDNRSLKKERRELKEKNTDLSQKYVKQTANLTLATKQLTLAETKVEELRNECHLIGEELNVAAGFATTPESFTMMYDGHEATGYIHTHPYGLTATSSLKSEIMTMANIHYQIRTTVLLSMDVLPSIWGVPIYVRINGFAAEWNSEIDECLAGKIMNYYEGAFPKLHARIKASKEALVDELKMRPETMAAIKESKFDTVHSVACIPSAFHEHIPFMQGEQRIEVINACRVWADQWDKDNGGVEQLYVEAKTKRAPKFYSVRK
nr:MAG TPA: hypothetical protein [Caudoviricetes sp.]